MTNVAVVSMAFHQDGIVDDAVAVSTAHGLGPVWDGLIRGALAAGFLGLGVGALAAEWLDVPFDATFQWGSAGGGALVGVWVGIRWGLRHRL